MLNVLWLQLLKREDWLLFSVFNIITFSFGLLSGQNKRFKDVTSSCLTDQSLMKRALVVALHADVGRSANELAEQQQQQRISLKPKPVFKRINHDCCDRWTPCCLVQPGCLISAASASLQVTFDCVVVQLERRTFL